MRKTTKFYLTLLVTLFYSLGFIKYSPKAFSETFLVEDSSNTSSMTQHFRKSSDKIDITNNPNLNLSGLDKLNISGSGQFTDYGLGLIKNSIGNDFSIIDIDLREESHGFINGLAVSWANDKNNSNAGLSLNEVIANENKKLESIPLNKPILLHNKNKEIIPVKVESEYSLTKNNGISYLRIPVTDGHLPKPDMVELFTDFVKNQPENSWLHFHCKAGIGRTTTFMIMYDIINNCNDVNLNDIITRQVILSTMNKKDGDSFYTGERYSFLEDFYTKCKDQKVFAHSSSCDTINNNDSYIKNSIVPKFLYVISEENMTKEEQTMISSLQGIVATKSDEQIYILSPNEPDYEVWLKDLKDNYHVKYKIEKSPWKLVKKFSSLVNGYIIYSNDNPPSINNACTLASLKDSITIEKSLQNKIKKHGISTLIENCSNTDSYWAFNNLWNKGLNHSIVLELSPDKTIALRDYAMVSKSLVFYEDEVNQNSLRELIYKSMDSDGHCLGWGPDEHTNVTIASSFGVDVVAADWSYNLSVLSSFHSKPLTQKFLGSTKGEDGFHYVTFIMSDGDNQQWFLGSNYTSKKWFGSSYRGDFNLGWSISPSIYHLAPTVFNKYYSSSSSEKYKDVFVTPPSGNGYMYPSKFPISKLDNYTKRLSSYMKDVDQNYVLILDDDAFYRTDLWDKYTSHSNINGLMYLDYAKNSWYQGKITWSNNKPIVSCRDLLWGGLEDETQLISNITTRVTSGFTHLNDPNSYTFVYVHVWSNTMDNVYNVIDKLNQNDKVKVVTPDDFMKLIQDNVTH